MFEEEEDALGAGFFEPVFFWGKGVRRVCGMKGWRIAGGMGNDSCCVYG